MKRIKVIENPSEIGAGTRGSSLAPSALRAAAENAGSKFYENHAASIIRDENKLLDEPEDQENAIRIDGIVAIYERVVRHVKSAFDEGLLPIIVAGDHSSAGGTIAGIKCQFPEKQLGVIWVDAHADLHSPYTTPSGNVHGMPLATALAIDNKGAGDNEVTDEERDAWEKLKALGGISPKIYPEDLVFIGVRATEEAEDNLIGQFRLKNISVEEIASKGSVQAAKEALQHLGHCELIYVSFDVDSLDKEISRGTGTPVGTGLSVEQAKQLLHTFAVDSRLCCLEIVEVNPVLDDKGNLMAEIAFDLLESTVGIIEKQQ